LNQLKSNFIWNASAPNAVLKPVLLKPATIFQIIFDAIAGVLPVVTPLPPSSLLSSSLKSKDSELIRFIKKRTF